MLQGTGWQAFIGRLMSLDSGNSRYIRPDSRLSGNQRSSKTDKGTVELRGSTDLIIYPDDTSLIGGRNVIIEMGLRIPRDISVAGYDGTMISQLLYPKLTTIRQNTEIIGSEAATRLIGTIEKTENNSR